MPIENEKLKAVIDTNVFISGLNFIKYESEILDLFMKGEIEVYISPFILREIERILRKKFKWGKDQIRQTLNKIKRKAILVSPKVRVSIIKEKDDDNRILECALEGKVQYIISGDERHLIPLREFKGIKILPASEFLKLI